MKKLFILAAALLVSNAALAQATASKDAQAVQKKIERSDATIADAKKAASANAWLERAGVMIDAATVYSKQLIAEMPVAQLLTPNMLGNPISIDDVTIGGAAMSKYVFENLDLYVSEEGNVQFWIVKNEIHPNSFFESLAALKKAKEINAKDFTGAGRGVQAVDRMVTESSIVGRSFYMLGNLIPAGKLFQAAFEASELKGAVDTISLYYAGICFYDGGEYKTALAELEKLLSFGSQQNGMTLSYIAACQDKLGEKDKAIETYEKAFALYPSNSNIMGGLINAYMSSNKNPEKVIELIKKAQEIDPKNVSLYLVESQIWDKIGNRANAIVAIEKAQQIDPKSLEAYFNAAVLNLMSSDDVVEKANKLDINDTKTYDSMMEQVKVLRLKAIEMLEKAYSVDPTSSSVIDLLGQIYFICRDYSEEIAAKHEKFSAEHPQK